MLILQLPHIYMHYERIPLDSVYKALRNKDLADCVVLAIRVLKDTDSYMKFKIKKKNSSEALQLRSEGRVAFCKKDYQKALETYNRALTLAPVNSEAMRLCYYSRAELLMETKQFRACMKDIETCLALNFPDSFVRKLQEMQAVALPAMCFEQLANEQTVLQVSTPFTEQFFTLKGDRNPNIPCATSDVEVIMESGKPKVVAAKDIPVGTVLAIETSFVAATHMKSNHTSCHYCLKKNLNLIPCEGCCTVMFCDEQCKQKAMQEGHNVECEIIETLLDDIKLPVKATLKIRQLCSSWDEFVKASNELGADRINNSTFAEIFGSDKFSLLNSHYDTHFIYGAMFNRCLYFANIIHYLDTHTSFLPNSPDDKSAAIHAVSRVMMHLSLYCIPVLPRHVTKVCLEGLAKLVDSPDKGYFPFIGQLANSCLPNAYVMGLWNSAALVTLAPVKKGAELTFSYAGHCWPEENEENIPIGIRVLRRHALRLFMLFRTVNNDCDICSGLTVRNRDSLNDAQTSAFVKFSKYFTNVMEKSFPHFIESHFKETCLTLQALSEVPCSKEYEKAFITFIKCLMHFVQLKFPNMLMSKD